MLIYSTLFLIYYSNSCIALIVNQRDIEWANND